MLGSPLPSCCCFKKYIFLNSFDSDCTIVLPLCDELSAFGAGRVRTCLPKQIGGKRVKGGCGGCHEEEMRELCVEGDTG